MNFSCCQLSPEGLETLFGKELKSLTVLNIRDNNLRKAAGYVIAKLFGSKGQIRVFDVQNNSLGDVGVSSIAGGFSSELNNMKLRIPSSSSSISSSLMLSKLSLHELDLSGNDIGDVGVIALCDGLKAFVKNAQKVGETVSLKILRLNRNRVTDKGASSLAHLINLGNLPQIIIEDKRMDGIHSIMKAALRSEDCHLPLLLEELGLSDNCIGSQGVNTILQAATRTSTAENSVVKNENFPADNKNISNPHERELSTYAPSEDMYHIPPFGLILRKAVFSRAQLTIESLELLSAYLLSNGATKKFSSSSFPNSPTSSSSPSSSDLESKKRKKNQLESPIHIDFQFSERDADNVLQTMASSCER